MSQDNPLIPDIGPIKLALACKCPKCGTGELYPPGLLAMELKDSKQRLLTLRTCVVDAHPSTPGSPRG